MAEKKTPDLTPRDDFQDQHDALGEQIRALQLKQMALGAQIGQRNLEVSVRGELGAMDPARRDAIARIATIAAKETQGTVSA